MSERVQNKVKEVAAGEAEMLKKYTMQAARSGAYLYPLKGIAYFLTHRPLWRPLASKLVPTLTLGTSITVFMFVFTYLPQAALMAFTSGPLAALSAALLVLSESSTLTTILSRSFLIQDALLDTFDGTLLSRAAPSSSSSSQPSSTSISNLVSSGRQLQPRGSDSMARLGKALKRPFAKYSPTAVIRYLLYLPLNFVPVVGSAVFVVLQGRRTGPDRLDRYFQLKGWGRRERDEHVERLQGAYTGFGVVATLLEMVPVAGILLNFTNTVGAALWAVELEKAERGREEEALAEGAKEK